MKPMQGFAVFWAAVLAQLGSLVIEGWLGCGLVYGRFEITDVVWGVIIEAIIVAIVSNLVLLLLPLAWLARRGRLKLWAALATGLVGGVVIWAAAVFLLHLDVPGGNPKLLIYGAIIFENDTLVGALGAWAMWRWMNRAVKKAGVF